MGASGVVGYTVRKRMAACLPTGRRLVQVKLTTGLPPGHSQFPLVRRKCEFEGFAVCDLFS